MPAFRDVLQAVAEAWRERKEEIMEERPDCQRRPPPDGRLPGRKR